jgi:hypothetical protein
MQPISVEQIVAAPCVLVTRAQREGNAKHPWHLADIPAHSINVRFSKQRSVVPNRALRSKLRADAERPARWEMFELLRSAFAADSPIRLDYVKTGPGAGEVIRVANG